jgi:Pilus formation protein N terminal region
MPAKLGAQCAAGMFIAILMTGIFPEARAEPVVLKPSTPDEGIEIARAGPVVLRPPASPGGTIEIAQAGSGKSTGDTVGRRDRPVVITTGSAQLLPLEKRAKTVIVGDHNLIDVVVENDRLAVLTAKDKPGPTNIIVLDEDGREVFAAPVIVVPPREGADDSVRIHDQKNLADYTPYKCGAGGRPRCNRIADDRAYVDRVLSQSRWDNQNLNYSGSLGGGGTAPAPPPGP